MSYLITKNKKSTRDRGVTVTVQRIQDDEDHVEVTPWDAKGGCMCVLALRVPKAAIDTVSPTGETTKCSGEEFDLAQLDFKDGAESWSDVLSQLKGIAQTILLMIPPPPSSLSLGSPLAWTSRANRPLEGD
jgi:hypothetical protein